MKKEKLFSKRFKIFAIITLILCFGYLIVDYIVKSNNLGFRQPYYNLVTFVFLIPLVTLLLWTLLTIYKKVFNKNKLLKAIGLIGFSIFAISVISALVFGFYTNREFQATIDGKECIYYGNIYYDNDTKVYYEIKNKFFYKIPYVKIDE